MAPDIVKVAGNSHNHHGQGQGHGAAEGGSGGSAVNSGAKCLFASSSPSCSNSEGAAQQTNGHSASKDAKAMSNSMYVDGWAARVHDDINLAVLIVMALVAAWSMWRMDSGMQYGLTVFAVAYMVLDGCWILCNPSGVKSPRTVLGHHAATLTVLMDPILHQQHAFYTACALLVEFNTFLLILRRRVVWGRFLEIPFALSWVALRLIWYPFLCFYFAMCTFPETLGPLYPTALADWRRSAEGGPVTPMFLGSYLAWVGICIFQGWWSCALVKSYSRPAREKKFL